MAKKTKKQAEQVILDEAVAAKGGKPGSDFIEELKKATGATAAEERTAEAAEHFDRRTMTPHREVLKLSQLQPMKANPRGELGDVTALVRSIEANGFIGALSVRETVAGSFEVWAGNRRLKAAKEAGLEEVTCDVYDLTEVQALELNLTEQINRADLSPLEEGEACRSLMELSGYSVQQVAGKLGQSASWVSKRLALCGLAPEVRRALTKGEVALTVAQALAALPSQKAQAEALRALDEMPTYEALNHQTAESKVEWLRAKCSRPLADATWKLTDELLVPEAGACSACPHNSATEKMPGLFDAKKGRPSCVNTACFEGKLKASWERKAEKARAAGAKVLSLAEGKKVMPHGSLPYGSRYCLADAVVQEDRQKRTWAQLVEALPKDARPALHVLQDGDGKMRELYLHEKTLAAVAEHLKLKWAVAQEEQQAERVERRKPEVEAAERAASEARLAVQREVLGSIARKFATDGELPLYAAQLLAKRAYASTGVVEAVAGRKVKEGWLEKEAGVGELLALVWLNDAGDEFGTYQGFDEDFLELAKKHGFDPQRMVATRLAAEGKAA